MLMDAEETGSQVLLSAQGAPPPHHHTLEMASTPVPGHPVGLFMSPEPSEMSPDPFASQRTPAWWTWSPVL